MGSSLPGTPQEDALPFPTPWRAVHPPHAATFWECFAAVTRCRATGPRVSAEGGAAHESPRGESPPRSQNACRVMSASPLPSPAARWLLGTCRLFSEKPWRLAELTAVKATASRALPHSPPSAMNAATDAIRFSSHQTQNSRPFVRGRPGTRVTPPSRRLARCASPADPRCCERGRSCARSGRERALRWRSEAPHE